MNECIFFLHLLIASCFLWPACRLGKEALICWTCIQPILANLFVLKQITLFGFTVTCSDVYAVSCALGLNLLQEYYGKDAAKKSVFISFVMLLFFVVMAAMHLLYTQSPSDYTHAAYSTILSSTPRLVAASVVTFLIVQWFDVQFFGFLKEKFLKLSLFARNSISLTISQCIDTLLFTFLGLWGLVSDLFDVFLLSFIIKLSITLLLSLCSLKSFTPLKSQKLA
jgi:uncharacterized integral membrane protein (TIGR00697 family)